MATASEKRGRLEDAYDACLSVVPVLILRGQLRSLEKAARNAINGGSVQQFTANGQHVQFFGYGPGQLTPLEVVELYRSLVDKFDEAFLFLLKACQSGLDAFNVMFTCWPDSVVTVTPPANQVIVDQTGRWANLCAQYDIDPTTVIGTPISTNGKTNDAAIFLWLMYFTEAVVEARDDHSQIRIATGASFA